jgi:GTP-binding protein
VANYHTIRKELADYTIPLDGRPEIVCVSKAELTGADAVRDRLAAELGREVLLFSAVTGQGLSVLVGRVLALLTELKAAEPKSAARPPVEFPTEAAVRTEDFKTQPTPGEGMTNDPPMTHQ